ncbi:hypothetical protein LINGRAHAP2_LOCUS21392, partial [Linum grandiflorum]
MDSREDRLYILDKYLAMGDVPCKVLVRATTFSRIITLRAQTSTYFHVNNFT